MKNSQISFFVAVALGISAGALATSEGTTANGSESPLEEVMVTAQRRSENVQSVPIAITALNGSDLEGKDGVLSARLTLQAGTHWTAEAYGTNLTDKVYPTGQVLNGTNYFNYGPPRQYGLRVGYTF